jgi:flagellar L-ring protein precursor FlgH
MLKTIIIRCAAILALVPLANCGSLDRMANIGKAPDLNAIEVANAPQANKESERVIVPAPQPAAPQYAPNSLWQTGARGFFKDQRASKVGDLLTVMIDISDQASLDNKTSRSRSAGEDSGISKFLGLENEPSKVIPNFDPTAMLGADSSSSFAGEGTVGRSETVKLTVAAIVTGVLPNGNLIIRGRQEVRVNFEARELFVAGIVRPEDISSGNTIQHTQIAEARIAYGGRGQLTDVQQPRYGQQLMDIVFPF